MREPKHNMGETLITLAGLIDQSIAEHEAYRKWLATLGDAKGVDFFARSITLLELVLPYIEGLASVPLISAPHEPGKLLVGVVVGDDLHDGQSMSPAWCLTTLAGVLHYQTQDIPPEEED